MKPVRITALAGALLVAACARQSPLLAIASAADSAAVSRMLASFDSCARTGALDVFIGYSADDIVMLAPDQPAVVGKDAVREWYRNFYGTFQIEMHHAPLETHSVGDLVITRGNATSTIAPKAGGPAMSSNTKVLMVFRRQADGSLKAWRVAFNSDAPPPAAAPGR